MGDPFYSCCNPADPIAVTTMEDNHHFLTTWLGRFPKDIEDTDEDTYIRSLIPSCALSRRTIRDNLHIIDQLQRMPHLLHLALTMRHLDRSRLIIIEHVCIGVADEHLPTLDQAVVDLLTPTKPNQALPTPRTIADKLRAIILTIDPPAIDHTPPPHEEQFCLSPSVNGLTDVQVTYRPDEAMELDTIVSTAARRNGCTKARALLDLVRGQAEVKVTFNLYAPTLDDGPVSFNGSHILDATAAQEWRKRATTTRTISEVEFRSTPSYAIPDTYKVFVKGRDGGCRFPGCSAGPERCDIDHVVPFADGGKTTPHNLQCLCRTCHNLKTDGVATARMNPDATVTWTIPGGQTVTTTPRGIVPHRTSRWAATFAEVRERRQRR